MKERPNPNLELSSLASPISANTCIFTALVTVYRYSLSFAAWRWNTVTPPPLARVPETSRSPTSSREGRSDDLRRSHGRSNKWKPRRACGVAAGRWRPLYATV